MLPLVWFGADLFSVKDGGKISILEQINWINDLTSSDSNIPLRVNGHDPGCDLWCLQHEVGNRLASSPLLILWHSLERQKDQIIEGCIFNAWYMFHLLHHKYINNTPQTFSLLLCFDNLYLTFSLWSKFAERILTAEISHSLWARLKCISPHLLAMCWKTLIPDMQTRRQ